MKKSRPPIVSVLGHVDHGKTTLLDTLRKSNVQAGEAGGITQSIGASTVKTEDGREITFIDTPGHAVFEKMRSRGANVADIVILVVAADDGVMPQTKEAIKHIRKDETPFVVAITKTDLDRANVDSVVGQLEKEGILFEGRGGDTPRVLVSGKTGEGMEDLKEMILLVAEVNEIDGSADDNLESVVIETGKDKKGIYATLVVKSGTLKTRQEIKFGEEQARVRGIFDEHGVSIDEVLPGHVALVIGFSDMPVVGAVVTENTEGLEKKQREFKKEKVEIKEGDILVLVKADSSGALEALLASLPEGVSVVGSGVGDVIDKDVFLAKSVGAGIYAYGVKTGGSVGKLADTEGVEIETFGVIYELTKRLEELVEDGKEKILGRAEILAEFPFNKMRVAGCKLLEGKIKKGDSLKLIRKEEEIGQVRATSLRKQKEEVIEVSGNEEFGLLLSSDVDFEKGDVLISVAK